MPKFQEILNNFDQDLKKINEIILSHSVGKSELIQEISSRVKIPVVALGGAGSIEDLGKAKENGASAVGAGSLFIYQRKHRAVLITYPNQVELDKVL
jgi:cyclase